MNFRKPLAAQKSPQKNASMRTTRVTIVVYKNIYIFSYNMYKFIYILFFYVQSLHFHLYKICISYHFFYHFFSFFSYKPLGPLQNQKFSTTNFRSRPMTPLQLNFSGLLLLIFKGTNFWYGYKNAYKTDTKISPGHKKGHFCLVCNPIVVSHQFFGHFLVIFL